MSSMTVRGWCLGFLVLAAAAPAEATPPSQAVPPGLELQILDPGVDPRGMPTAIPQPIGGGLAQIDIPQTVIVHRYYYTGDRSFQGPLLRGGPCTIVAHHPRNGERVYIPVQLLPGAPRITYRAHSIEYDFGNQGIKICFGILCHQPRVEYRSHPSVTHHVHDCVDKVHTTSKNLFERTGIPNAGRKAAEVGKNVTLTTIDNTREVAKMAITPLVQVSKIIPGINLLQSAPEDLASQQVDVQQQRFAIQQQSSKFGLSIPMR